MRSNLKGTQVIFGLFLIILAVPLSIHTVKQNQEIKAAVIFKSKLGIQTQWQKSGVMDFIEEARPTVVKLMGDYSRAVEIKRKSPNTFIVGRIWEQNQSTDGTPETRAQQWFDRNRNTLLISGINCWEGYNEPLANTAQLMRWYSRFEIKRMNLLESIGKKAYWQFFYSKSAARKMGRVYAGFKLCDSPGSLFSSS